MKLLIPISSLLALLVASVLPAGARDWIYGKQDHIEVLSRVPANTTREVFREVFLFPSIVRAVFEDLPAVEPSPILLVVVDNAHTMRAFLPDSHRGAALTSFFEETPHLDLMVILRDRHTTDQIYSLLYRDFALKLLRPFSLPPWFQAGVSDLLGNIELQRGQARIGFISTAQLQPVRNQGIIPLKEFFAQYPTFTPGEYREEAHYYSQAALLAHYFLFAAADERRRAFLSFLVTAEALLGEEKDFAAAVGLNYEQLEQILRQYARRSTYTIHRYGLRNLPRVPNLALRRIEPIRERSLVARAEVAAGQLDRAYLSLAHHLSRNEPVADLYRAAHFLFLARQEHEKAEAMAEQALALGSDSQDLLISLGLIEIGAFIEAPLDLLEDDED